MGRGSVWAAMVLMCAGAPAAADEPEANPSFYLVNRATVPVTRVFATPAGQDGWGVNRIPNLTIPPGANYPIRLPADGRCLYDIRVVWANGQAEEQRRLDACEIERLALPSGGAGPVAPAARTLEQPTITLINRGAAALSEFYLSGAASDSWGEEQLGTVRVPSGGSAIVPLPPGDCVFDIRMVWANGQARERRRMNLCQISSLRVP